MSLIFFVLCYSILRAFVIFGIILRLIVHHGTGLPFIIELGLFKRLHDSLQGVCNVSSNFFMKSLIFICPVIIACSLSFRSFALSYVFSIWKV